ncbi:hypothetical protein OKW28_000172 [Paraburkholderia sp. 40]
MIYAALCGIGLAYVSKHLAETQFQARRLSWVLEDWFPTFVGQSRAVELVVDALKSGYRR